MGEFVLVSEAPYIDVKRIAALTNQNLDRLSRVKDSYLKKSKLIMNLEERLFEIKVSFRFHFTKSHCA